MNQKMIYIFSLVGFFLLWGVFGFAAAAPREAIQLQGTVPPSENTPIFPGEPEEAGGIPVTGEPEPVWTEIVGFYGLIGLAALCLILAMLSFANKLTAPAVEHKQPPTEENHNN